jgi:VIT1/CCC1 family predicted Fe2+/Mn2+ transporter
MLYNKVMQFFRNYLKEFVYGSIDGTVTTFAVIAGSAGANLSSSVVIILGISNVLADGFSMASSNYLSEKSQKELDGIIKAGSPVKKALATFFSFVLIGSVPLIPYLANLFTRVFAENLFLASCIFTSIAFLFIGQVRSQIAHKSKIYTGLETLVIGGIAAAVAYGAGAFLRGIV